MRLKVYFGKVCAKHPELKGERYLNNGNCVVCQLVSFHKYAEENREAKSARTRKWREENKEAAAAYERKRHEENREAKSARTRKWREENKEAVAAYERKRESAFKAKHGISRRAYYHRLRKEQQCAVN